MPAEFRTGHMQQVERDAEQQGAEHDFQNGIKAQIAEGKPPPVVLPAVPAGDGKGNAEIEQLLAKPVQGH